MNAQEILDRARLPLNDAEKERYLDEDGLLYLREGVRTIRRLRPDCFVGRLGSDPAADIVLNPPSEVQIEFEHYQALSDYVSARWQDRDDDLTGEKAAAWLTMAVGALT
ncbi:MAG: hypothetical protein J0H00_10815 [Burkholderiales bacterium]|nr:hypothetical protein [Burkholderiales bacterium]